MKLNGKSLVAVAMVLGAMSALGCKKSEEPATQQGTAAEAQPAQPAEQSAAQSPAKKDENTTIFASASVGTKAQIPAPPAERAEDPGRAPSRDHMWIKGQWRWDHGRTSYVWVPGHWTIQYAPAAPPAPRSENPGRPPTERHIWVKGHWKWTGRDWMWIGGHWDVQRGNSTYIAPHWNKRHGRWQYVPGRWERK